LKPHVRAPLNALGIRAMMLRGSRQFDASSTEATERCISNTLEQHPLLSYGQGDRTTARIKVSRIPRRALLPRGSRGRRDKLKAFLRSAFEGVRLSSPWDNREPIREELFGVERLEDHARSLAVAQIVSSRASKGRVLAKRLAENRAVLLRAYRSAVKAINDGRPVTPAAEWLVDNYHLVERRIHEIRSDLPPGYYRQLPKLADGPFTGYPRVFGIAWAFIAHSDSRFDSEMLVRFVRAYQEVQPLTIGELWAVSITLRVVLIENLGRRERSGGRTR
jgi:cyclic beta-1,2-glucan synthetase